MVTLFNVISEDGFIARPDDSEDFIPNELWPATLKLIARYDTFVMGRRTYDEMQTYLRETLESFERLPLKKVVVSRNKDLRPNPELGYVVAHSPQEALKFGNDVLVSSGPTLNTFLLQNKLINKVIFHQIPVKIGEGIKPFNIETLGILTPVSRTPLDNMVKELTFELLG